MLVVQEPKQRPSRKKPKKPKKPKKEKKMPDVKFLIAGDPAPSPSIDKGDVIEVVPSTSDWGSSTVAPNWIRLTVTGINGAPQFPNTQQGAEDKARGWLSAWQDAFTYSEVAGAAEGMQRYRVEAGPEIVDDLDAAVRIQLRDSVVARLGGTIADQGPNFVEVDADPGWPLDEIAFVINQLSFRRFKFPDALVDSALSGSTDGQPLEFTRTRQQANNLIIDKLRN